MTAPRLGLPPGCWCVWKCWYLEGMLWFTSKGRIFFTGLLSHHHTLSPRYMFHVLRNSIAPSPLLQARHLDRLDPSLREQWMKEWRSFRGGGQVKRSRLSTPPSPTLGTPADIYPQSPTTSDIMGDEFTLNVSYQRPVNTWEADVLATWTNKMIIYSENCQYSELAHEWKCPSIELCFTFGGVVLHKCNQGEMLFLSDLWQIIDWCDELIL